MLLALRLICKKCPPLSPETVQEPSYSCQFLEPLQPSTTPASLSDAACQTSGPRHNIISIDSSNIFPSDIFWDILPLQQGAGLKSEDPQWVLILLLQCRTLERALDPLDQFENAESPWGVPWNPFPITFSNHETKFILSRSRSPHPKAGQRLMVKLRSCMLTTLPFNKLPVSTVMTLRTKECNGRVKNANWFSESCSLSSRKNIGVKMYYLPAHFLNVNVNLLKVQRSRA